MQAPDPENGPRERVVLDASVLLGGRRRYLYAAADLGYYVSYWSSWIVAELVRKRTEWIAERAVEEGRDLAEMRRRFLASRRRVNAVMDDLSRTLHSVDYSRAPADDLDWLKDADDWPIMRTALAAAVDTLVTDNSRDFPLGERRNGVLLLGSEAFLAAVSARFPDAEAAIRAYLEETVPSDGSAPSP